MEKYTVTLVSLCHTEVVLKNEKGETFTFNPTTRNGEELYDFLIMGSLNNDIPCVS